jgi:deoxyadenosine/deoxycytidine kinase
VLVLGLTGGIGSGKSTVDQLLAEASQLSKEAQTALDAKDLGTYQSKVAQLSDVLGQLITARTKETGKAPTTGSTTSSSSSTTTTTRAKTSGTQALGAPRR